MTTRALSTALLLGACALALPACNAGPTYGTGVSQGQQLFDDLDNIVTLGNSNRQAISYAPRPELVRPAAIGALPPPRTGAAYDPNWPQSPEVARARNIAAAEATRGEGLLPADYNPRQSSGDPVAVGPSPTNSRALDASTLSPQYLRGQRQAAQQAQAAAQITPDRRRYLSEPPVAYRQPVATAPVGDTGVDEAVKERRAGGTRSLGSRIREALPF